MEGAEATESRKRMLEKIQREMQKLKAGLTHSVYKAEEQSHDTAEGTVGYRINLMKMADLSAKDVVKQGTLPGEKNDAGKSVP